MNRRLERGEEAVTSQDIHRKHMAIIEHNWGPQEPKKRWQCAFPLCEKKKSKHGGAWCAGHKKQRTVSGVEMMRPLWSTGPRQECWETYKELNPKAKDTPWRCAWVGCRARSQTKLSVFCGPHDYRFRKYRKENDLL